MAASEPPPTSPTPPPPDRCPKCERDRRSGEAACSQCGLLVVRWPGYRAAPPPSPVLDELWSELEGCWQDAALHARLLDRAAGASELDLAAARYRLVLRERPDDEWAKQGLARAALLAERLSVARADAERPRIGRWLRVLTVVGGLVLLLASLWLLVLVLRRRPG